MTALIMVLWSSIVANLLLPRSRFATTAQKDHGQLTAMHVMSCDFKKLFDRNLTHTPFRTA